MSSIVIAVIAALASVAAAVIAGMFALATRRFEARLQRSDQAHAQSLEHKRSMYAPLVDMLERMFTTSDLPTQEWPSDARHDECAACGRGRHHFMGTASTRSTPPVG
jgi:hypothetical protein